jgi:hypothetical protein
VSIPEGILSSVQGFFSRAATEAAKDFSSIFVHIAEIEPTVASGLAHLAKAIEQAGGSQLIQLAQHAVAAAEAVDGPPDQKYAAARQAVVDALNTRGMPVVWNAINGAIEAAVGGGVCLVVGSAVSDIINGAVGPAFGAPPGLAVGVAIGDAIGDAVGLAAAFTVGSTVGGAATASATRSATAWGSLRASTPKLASTAAET